MELSLHKVCKKVGKQMHISDVSLTLKAGTLNILLGPTLSGKTSLMRLMAGLDQPTSGKVLVDGRDVVNVPVQKRNVAMVYQQFINYPNLSVYENIASPMRIAGLAKKEIDKKVLETAELLKLSSILQRSPQELSGGQQQRTALARALVKGADLVLLDEPLANLDYKLREELREEFPKIFAATGAIFVYATTEPSEALLLGGNTVTLHQGKITQFGPTLDVFSSPKDITTAQTFSDPPLNLMPVSKKDGAFYFNEIRIDPWDGAQELADGEYTIAFRPYSAYLEDGADRDVCLKAQVQVSEITGSESFIHMSVGEHKWVVLAAGIHNIDIDTEIDIYMNPREFYLFNSEETLVMAPHGKQI